MMSAAKKMKVEVTGLTLRQAADALTKDVIVHKILPLFNPYKLGDLQEVLSLRKVLIDADDGRRRLVTDMDLKECYFEDAWQFRKDEFVLANWQEVEVGELKRKVREAHPCIGGQFVYPPEKVNVDTLENKEDIVRAYPELAYVPAEVYKTAVGGAHVLRSVKAGDIEEDPVVVRWYLQLACRACLEASVICWLAEKCGEDYINDAVCGHTDVVDLLVNAFGVRIGVGCLLRASQYGQDAMIDLLVKKYGVDPNEVDAYGGNALHWAARDGRVRTVKHLVEKHNVDIHATDNEGKTALDLAWSRGRTECVALLREYTYKQLVAGEYGGDVDVRLLWSAVKRGDDAMIDLLVDDYGVDPNVLDDDYNGWNALHFAAWHGHVRTVKQLVEKYNVDIYARDMRGNNALQYAEERGMLECVAVLREYTFKQLVAGEYGGDVDVPLLLSAVRRGDDPMIDLLVEKYGVDPNAVDDGARNALHYAVKYGRIRTVEHLVEKYKVDMHARNEKGKNALDLAEDLGRPECVAVLREYTYKQLVAGEYGGVDDVRLLVSAVKRGDDAMIDLLVQKYGVDPNAVDAYGWIALHWAAFCGRVRTVKDLVEKYNVDIHARAWNGKTALDLAEEYGRPECAAVLRGCGASNGQPVESTSAKTP